MDIDFRLDRQFKTFTDHGQSGIAECHLAGVDPMSIGSMFLRGSEHSGDFTYQAVLEMAQASIGEDPFGYRTEFVSLVQRAIELQLDPKQR